MADIKKNKMAGSNEDSLIKRLGPGLITGASDDDPSGIGTYSQAGAQLGFGVSWRHAPVYRENGSASRRFPSSATAVTVRGKPRGIFERDEIIRVIEKLSACRGI